MKTALNLILISFILIAPTYSQVQYDSIMTPNKIWSCLIGGYGADMIECCHSTSFLKIETDTAINTIDEKQVMESTDSLRSWKKIGNIRESGEKIYFRDLKNNQGLLYDFGASTGDTIKIVNYSLGFYIDTIKVWVTKIDTIDFSGIQRKRIKVEGDTYALTDYWIAGIGSEKGLLNPCIMLCGGFRELLCVYENDTQIYFNNTRNSCYMSDNKTSIENIGINDLKIYPNPTNGFIKVDYSGEISGLSYSVYNLTGQLILKNHFKTNEANINLNSGLYILKINKNESLIFKDKLMIINSY